MDRLFQEPTTLYGFALSPHGKRLAITYMQHDQSYLAWFDVATTRCIKLISFPIAGQALSWSPDGTRLVCSGDSRAQPSTDLYLIGETATLLPLISTPHHHITFPTWDLSGTRLAFAQFQSPPERRSPEIMILDLRSMELRQQTSGGGSLPHFAPHGKTLVFYRPPHLWLFDLERQQERQLTDLEQVLVYPGCFSPDGSRVLFEYGPSDMRQIAHLDLATQAVQVLSSAGQDARGPSWSPTGEISYVENHRCLKVISSTGTPVWKCMLPNHHCIDAYPYTAPQWARSGVLALRDQQEPNIWLASAGTVPRQLTSFPPPRVGIVPQIIQYAGRDGRHIPAFLFIPHVSHPKSGVIWVHGGPHSQTNPHDPYVQALLALGYVVLAPDYQGSTGHGPEWEQLPADERGETDLLDVVDGHAFLKETLHIHPSCIAIAGYSYGGYLALLAMARFPDRWAAGVSLWGIWDAREIQRMASPLQQGSRWDEAWLNARSPNFLLQQIQAPLLILHGAYDTTSTLEEVQSAACYLDALCDLHIFWDDGHGLPRHRKESSEMLLHFLQQHLS